MDAPITARGGVKDHAEGTEEISRRVRLTGEIRSGEVRVDRGGVARRAHREETPAAVVDPAAETPAR